MTPLENLASWLEDARAQGVKEAEAMALATVGRGGAPTVRIVLCRGIDERGVRFFTNYESKKARDIAEDPRAAAVFHWATLGRQVRVEGRVDKLSAEESDAYFHSRARGSQLAACVSPQSQPIESVDVLRVRQRELDERLKGGEVPRPSNWGGYVLIAQAVELWIAGADRLHDRTRYEKRGAEWGSERLAP